MHINWNQKPRVIVGIAAGAMVLIIAVIIALILHDKKIEQYHKEKTERMTMETDAQATDDTGSSLENTTATDQDQTDEQSDTLMEEEETTGQDQTDEQDQTGDATDSNLTTIESAQSAVVEVVEDTSTPEIDTGDYVAQLSVANTTTQLIVVSASGTQAEVSMHQKDASGNWNEIMSTTGYVGKDGVGSASEYSSKTPAGCYNMGQAFGVNANPGVSVSYIQVDDSYYWVDDVTSPYYNQFVTTNQVSPDNWTSAEHITDYPQQYAYVVAIGYNTACVPGAGSAIFLHCSNGKATAGCVAIPQSQMIFVLQNLQSDCKIVIANGNEIMNY